MQPVRRVQTTRGATERRALASELSPAECAERLSEVTWIETGENQPVAWPMPEGKSVYGWVSSDGFMISPARQHERLSLDLAWGGWQARDGITLIAVDLLSLKSARLLLLCLPVVALVAFLGFSLLAGELLLELVEMLAVAAVVGAIVAAVIIVDERRSRADHRRLFALVRDVLEAAEVPRAALPADLPPLPPAPERPEPPSPVPWRR